ncbi:MAG: ABC transporter permease subunit [Georgenia sp.]
MIHLTRVELRRLLSRYLVIAAFVGALLATGALLFATWQTAKPMSPAQTAEAERYYQQALADWEENGQEMIAQCLEDQARQSELEGTELDFGCEQQEPQREWFVMTAPQLPDQLPGQLSALGTLLLFAALLVGATGTAAEISTGAIGNWLTFEPRRLLVYASKLLAAGLVVLPVAMLLLLVTTGGTWLIADRFALADTMTSQHWGEAGWMGLRLLAITCAAAVVGAALGFLLKHTAAVLGVAVGYFIVVEGMFSGVLSRFQPWLLMRNIESWMLGGTVYYVDSCTTGPTGTSCESAERALSLAQAAGYLGAGVVVVVVVAGLVFRRRDVA